MRKAVGPLLRRFGSRPNFSSPGRSRSSARRPRNRQARSASQSPAKGSGSGRRDLDGGSCNRPLCRTAATASAAPARKRGSARSAPHALRARYRADAAVPPKGWRWAQASDTAPCAGRRPTAAADRQSSDTGPCRTHAAPCSPWSESGDRLHTCLPAPRSPPASGSAASTHSQDRLYLPIKTSNPVRRWRPQYVLKQLPAKV